MGVSFVLIKQLLIMVVYSAAGYVLTRKKLLTEIGCKDLTNILLYLIIPVTIINSFLVSYDDVKTKLLIHSIVASLIALVLSMLISYALFNKRDRVSNFSSSFSNAGFIGIPLIQSVFGSECVFYVASFVAFLNIFQWIYGVFILTDDLKEVSINKIIKNPVLIAFIIAIALYFLNLNDLSFIKNITSSLSVVNSPLAMILIGSFLTKTTIKEMLLNKNAIKCCISRLIIIPLLTIFIFNFVNVDNVVKTSVLLVCSAPVGANVAMFSKMYNNNYKHAVEIVVLSSLLSIFTMPLMMWFNNI